MKKVQCIYIVIVIISFILSIPSSIAQGEWTTYQTTNTGSNGLGGNWVTDIAEDAQNNIWFTSTYGITKFDGSDWTNFLPYDSSESHLSATEIAIDQNNNVWVGTGIHDGLYKYNGSTWTVFTEDDGLINNSVTDLCVDDNTVWIGTYYGISKYYNNNFSDLNIGDSIQSIVFNYETGQFDTIMTYRNFWVRALAVDSDKNLWAAATYFDGSVSTGILRMYDENEWTEYTTDDGLIDNVITCIAVDDLGNLWFGSENGVSKYDHSTWTNFTVNNGLISNNVRSITSDSTGAIWFGTPVGASKFEGNTWTDYTKDDGLVSDKIKSLYTDKSGNTWIGTQYGTSVYNGSTFVSYSTTDGLINNSIRGIDGSDNGIWIGTERGASFFDGQNWSGYTTNNGLSGDYVDVGFDDSNGNNWFGITNNPLTMLNGVNDTIFGTNLHHVSSIVEDNYGNLWFGNYSGVHKYDGINWTSMQTDTLAPWGVKSLAIDSSGNIWAGLTYGIIGKYDGSTWQMDTLGEGIYNYHVRSIVVDSSGDIWSHASSLFKYDGNSWIEFDSLSGFTSNYTSNIALDKNNYLWLSTPYGVTKYDGTNFINYTKDDGLIDTYIGYVGVDDYNDKWFGSYKYGLSRYCESMSLDGYIDYLGTGVTNGNVYLFRSLDNSVLELVNTSSIDTSGHYQFNITTSGNYVVSALGDFTSYPNTIETYYHSGNYSCNNYELISISCDDSVSNINISLADAGSVISSNYTYVDNGGGNYSFNNNSTGNYNLSHWAFGDGYTSLETHPSHNFSANGTFIVVLTVTDTTDGNFCFDYFIDTITVTEVTNPLQCVAGFVSYPDWSSQDVIVVNSSIGNNISYLWDFGDGNTSESPYPSHYYETSGPFNVCLKVDDGTCSDMYCDSIGLNGVVLRQTGFNLNVVPVVSTGINNNTDIVPVTTIYPNPTTDYITIKSELKVIEAQVFSISGKSQKIITSNFEKVNITDLPSGIYIIKCITKKRTITTKFLKQ